MVAKSKAQGKSHSRLRHNCKLMSPFVGAAQRPLRQSDRTIYKAAIGETELSKPTKIITADEVPDIHWAFLGPPVPEDFKIPGREVMWWRKQTSPE